MTQIYSDSSGLFWHLIPLIDRLLKVRASNESLPPTHTILRDAASHQWNKGLSSLQAHANKWSAAASAGWGCRTVSHNWTMLLDIIITDILLWDLFPFCRRRTMYCKEGSKSLLLPFFFQRTASPLVRLCLIMFYAWWWVNSGSVLAL